MAARMIIISTEIWAREQESIMERSREENNSGTIFGKKRTNCFYWVLGTVLWLIMNQREITEIIGSWLVISVAFAWVMQDRTGGAALSQSFLPSLAITLVAVGTGFIFHELAHKYASIHYGAHAEFFAWPVGLGIALLLAFTVGIVFAAPGAVYIMAPHLSKKQNGIISAVGPITNILIGLVFFVLGIILAAIAPQSFLKEIAIGAFQINFVLAFFNMLPIFPLDGSKVFAWDKGIWAAIIGTALLGPIILSLLVSAAL